MKSKSLWCLFSIAMLLSQLQSLHAQRLNHVIEFMPAPGQFINTLPIYEAGDDSLAILAKADALIANNGLLSLGAFGGYVIFACPQGIANVTGEYDFRVLGNAFNNNSEPGVIMVMKDVNGNGLPDDEWYDIWGSEHDDENSNLHYQITYYKPTAEKEAEQAPTDYLLWRDNEGNSGYVSKNRFHAQR